MFKTIFIITLLLAQHTTAQHSAKVRVGVWELYDKYALPDSCVAKNTHELKNGIDDDGNGFIDDINGIYFNAKEQLEPNYFYANYENKASYDHGTAVANIICKENPNVAIVGVGFVPTSLRLQQSGILEMSVAERQANLENEYTQMQFFVGKSLEWFNLQKVQFVNISWGLNLNGFLENNQNLGNTTKERRKYAKQWLKTFKRILEDEFAKYPYITFVVAAGNEGLEVNQALDVPGSIVAKNVMVVGALGKDGKRASFSNYGKNVTQWAIGEEVEVVQALKSHDVVSGTSFAAPVITAKFAEEHSKNN